MSPKEIIDTAGAFIALGVETLQTRKGGKSLPNNLPGEIAKFLNDEAALLD